MHLRIFSEATHNSVWHLRSRIKEWVQWPSQYKTSTHHSYSANCLLRQLIFYREGCEQTSVTFRIFVKWISMCSLTLLSLNSLKYSLGVATAAAGEPVVLIMSLNSLRAASLSWFQPKFLNHINSSFPVITLGGFGCYFVIFIRSLVGCDFDQFLPAGLLCSSPLFLSRSQVSVLWRRNNQSSEQTWSRLLHEMMLHGSLETNNTVMSIFISTKRLSWGNIQLIQF